MVEGGGKQAFLDKDKRCISVKSMYKALQFRSLELFPINGRGGGLSIAKIMAEIMAQI